MRWTFLVTATLVLALSVAASSAHAQAQADFQKILDDLNDESFESMRRAIDPDDMLECVYGLRTIDQTVRGAVFDDFWTITQSVVMSVLPNRDRGKPGELIGFEFEAGQGTAIVRYPQPGYRYTYLAFELYHDDRERLRIRNWYDSSAGLSFCAQFGDALIMIMPSKEGARQQLDIVEPTDLQLFQVTEIFKAGRDQNTARFFEIYDQVDETLKRQPLIARLAMLLSYQMRDQDRYESTMRIFVDIYEQNPAYSMVFADYYLLLGMFESALQKMDGFRNVLQVEEGATPARMSAAALALGQNEQAEEYAVMATTLEPSLELGWWSLLRARARVSDYEGCIEALTHLEDDFGKRIDASKLRRDRFKAFGGLANSQEFKEWRASRP